MAKEAKCKVTKLDGELVFAFVDGGTHNVLLAELEATHAIALRHGYAQKLGDSYAGAKTGPEAEGLFLKVLDNLRNGEWKGERASGEVSDTPVALLAQAIANVGGIPLADAKAAVEAADPAVRRKLRTIPDVAVELAKLRTAGKPVASISDLLGL